MLPVLYFCLLYLVDFKALVAEEVEEALQVAEA